MNMMRCGVFSGLLVIAGIVPGEAAKEIPLAGIVAASVGEQVVLADAGSQWQAGFSTGPVGWLYPAPGGALFAPDLVNGVTTVFDLKKRLPASRLDGVSAPVFGVSDDRYLVVAGYVLMVSYPERALMAEIEAELVAPWQSVITPEETSLLVLERNPTADGPSLMSAFDLLNRRQVYRQELAGEVVRMALAPGLGLLGLVDVSSNTIRLVDPATLGTMLEVPLPAQPRDVAFVGEREALVVAVASDSGAAELLIWQLKAKRGKLKLRSPRKVPLAQAPIMLAVAPWQSHVAVAREDGKVDFVETKRWQIVRTLELPGVPRHMVWCNPLREGPLLPDWSDEKKPELPFGSSFGNREQE